MPELTRILAALKLGNGGDTQAAAELLPLVYDELRKLAALRLQQEKPGQTLQATALVHEAYLRLLGNHGGEPCWNGRGHFFAAAAEAMRRILVENARRKHRHKHGGNANRVELTEANLVIKSIPANLLEMDEALDRLAKEDPPAAEVVKLHGFAGLSVEQAGEALGISRAGAYRHWTYARAWLRCEIEGV